MANTSAIEREPYNDYLVDLLSALSPYGRWKEWLFVVLRCYLDESESKGANDPAVCVAGYVAQGKHWDRFAKAWNKALDKAPKYVEVFHATDYAGKRKSKHGNFNGWTETQREAWIDGLIATIKSHKLIEMGVTIHRSTFNEVVTGKRGHRHGSFYVIAAKIAMVRASAWAVAKGYRHAPSFFVESGSQYYKALREAHRDLKQTPGYEEFFALSGFSEVPKSRAYPQTQPADMLAFYTTMWTSRLVGYDPGHENEKAYAEKYAARFNPEMPVELIKLLPSERNNVQYHTPRSLDAVLSSIERGGRRANTGSPPSSADAS